jgi:hypothetical protein
MTGNNCATTATTTLFSAALAHQQKLAVAAKSAVAQERTTTTSTTDATATTKPPSTPPPPCGASELKAPLGNTNFTKTTDAEAQIPTSMTDPLAKITNPYTPAATMKAATVAAEPNKPAIEDPQGKQHQETDKNLLDMEKNPQAMSNGSTTPSAMDTTDVGKPPVVMNKETTDMADDPQDQSMEHALDAPTAPVGNVRLFVKFLDLNFDVMNVPGQETNLETALRLGLLAVLNTLGLACIHLILYKFKTAKSGADSTEFAIMKENLAKDLPMKIAELSTYTTCKRTDANKTYTMYMTIKVGFQTSWEDFQAAAKTQLDHIGAKMYEAPVRGHCHGRIHCWSTRLHQYETIYQKANLPGQHTCQVSRNGTDPHGSEEKGDLGWNHKMNRPQAGKHPSLSTSSFAITRLQPEGLT